MSKARLSHDEVRVLTAVESLAKRAATRFEDIESFMRGQKEVIGQTALRRHLSTLFDKGFVCKSHDDSHFSITPRARWHLEDLRLRAEAS